MRIDIGGLIIAAIGLAITLANVVTFELWQNNGLFYNGSMDAFAFIVAVLGMVLIVVGLAMTYHEHGKKIGW